MSLVAYGSSDESSDEEINTDVNETQRAVNETSNSLTNAKESTNVKESTNIKESTTVIETVVNSKSHMSLPVPRYEQSTVEVDDNEGTNCPEGNKHRVEFGALPKPKSSMYPLEDIVEDDDIPLFQPKQFVPEKIVKPDRTPVRISVPSLSDFKDVDEDMEKSKTRRQPSKQGIGLFAILPPPQSEVTSKKNNFIPHVLTKTAVDPAPKKSAVDSAPKKPAVPAKVPVNIQKPVKNPLSNLDYDSNSDDDDDGGDNKRDFFSLSSPARLPEIAVSSATNFFSIQEDKDNENSIAGNEKIIGASRSNDSEKPEVDTMDVDQSQSSDMTLVSTVMNMPREEILLKNKAEVGPKLPVPEQEFNVDSEGNVAFDDKAIEYLCGKRGVKRKNQMIDEANIIEINGEDIKPDEREWLVKALTEEPVQRPVSMQGAGPSSQSKKKHQITYLAHQAKAMEVELKNTWSQNRMTRKQTQSKYGF